MEEIITKEKVVYQNIRPFLEEYFYDFQDFCFLRQELNYPAAVDLLIQVVERDKTLPTIQNKLRLRFYSVVYVKEIDRIAVAELTVASDYVHSIRVCLRMGIDPVLWLFDRISSLRAFSE